jgi:hypothetical protein
MMGYFQTSSKAAAAGPSLFPPDPRQLAQSFLKVFLPLAVWGTRSFSWDGEGVVFEVISRFGEALDEHDDAIAICLAHFGKGRHDSPGAAGAEGPEGAAEIGLEGELA